VGTEFRVNRVTDFKQVNPVAAFIGDKALVVWENPQYGLRGIFYGTDGSDVSGSAELALVPNKTLGAIPAHGEVISRKEPAIAVLPAGDFLLFWTEETADLSVDYFWENRVILERDIMGQRFDATGAPVGGSFRVNSTTAGFQTLPRVAVRNGGEAVVVWMSDDRDDRSTKGDGIFGQVVTRNGRLVGNELRIDTVPGTYVFNPAVAADKQGNFMVAWEACCDVGNDLGVKARLFDRTGTPRGGEMVVNAAVQAGRQRRPDVTLDSAGNFLVTWQGFLQAPQPLLTRIFGQFVSPAGRLLGAQFQISKTGGEDIHIAPAAALLPSGGFLVTWMSWIGTSPIGVRGVEIDAQGRLAAQELLISTGKIFPQYHNAVAVGPDGDAFVSWQGVANHRSSIVARQLESH
jgi:hypothetical protein